MVHQFFDRKKVFEQRLRARITRQTSFYPFPDGRSMIPDLGLGFCIITSTSIYLKYYSENDINIKASSWGASSWWSSSLCCHQEEKFQGAVNLNEHYQEMSPTSKLTCHSWSRFSDVIDKTKMLTKVKFQWHTYTSLMAIVDNFICDQTWIFNIVEFPE